MFTLYSRNSKSSARLLMQLISLFIVTESMAQSDARFLWAKSIGGSGKAFVIAMMTDSTGNIYVAGRADGSVDFDPGSGVAVLTGGSRVFFAKYDAAGRYIWARQLGATTTIVENSLAVDRSGNVILTGCFRGAQDFDPGSGSAMLASVESSVDIFLAKYDPSGIVQRPSNYNSYIC